MHFASPHSNRSKIWTPSSLISSYNILMGLNGFQYLKHCLPPWKTSWSHAPALKVSLVSVVLYVTQNGIFLDQESLDLSGIKPHCSLQGLNLHLLRRILHPSRPKQAAASPPYLPPPQARHLPTHPTFPCNDSYSLALNVWQKNWLCSKIILVHNF